MEIELSVILPAYNPAPEQLLRAVESVLRQSFADFELVICDDGSTPAVSEILAQSPKIAADPRIRLLRSEQNGGCAAALNRCIKAARGNLLLRQDADDYSLPERFEMIVAAYKESGAQLIGSNILLFDEGGEWGRRCYPARPTKQDFLFAVPFMHGACAMERAAVEKAGGYPEELVTARCEDYALFMKMYSQGAKGINLQRPLYAFREDSAAAGRRRYRDKINEARVKARGFRQLKLYPKGIFYLPKPLIVGLIPKRLLARLKDKAFRRRGE